MPAVSTVLETCLYASDLAAARRFYSETLKLRVVAAVEGRHVFFRCPGGGVILIFNPEATRNVQTQVGGALIPVHGATGSGHLAFRAEEGEIDEWREHLLRHGVGIESEVHWPGGGRSIYFRDPAGNSLEFATPKTWGL